MEGVVDRECHWKGPEGPGRDEGGKGGGWSLVLSFQIIGSPPGRSIAPMGWGARGVGSYGAAVVNAPNARPARWALKESVVVATTTWAGRAFQSLMDL